jgi:yecA family protein
VSNNKYIENYKALQSLYLVPEITENCVDIDFGYAFICAMASSGLELEQWMPLLFIDGESSFSNEKLASDFAQSVLALYQQANQTFQQGLPLQLMVQNSTSVEQDARFNFANGYLQALIMIDNMQLSQFEEGSAEANLQQTCFLLLDKLVTLETEDAQKLALFAQLPTNSEIIALLPELLTHYGKLCLAVQNDE